MQKECAVLICDCGAMPQSAGTASGGRMGRLLLGVASIAIWFFVYLPLQPFSRYLTYHVLSLIPGTHLAGAVAFFCYDAPKVLMLLTLVVFGVGTIRSLFTPERTRRILAGKGGQPSGPLSLDDRMRYGISAVKEILGRTWKWVLLGIAVGAGIHGHVPEGFMAGIMGSGRWWSVPLAVVFGFPMYSNAAGIVPVVEAHLAKGAVLGTVLAFMMSVIALSLPEMVILRKVLKVPLLLAFAGIVGCGILLVGYLFNLML